MERNKPNMRYSLTHNVYHLIHFRSSSQSLVCYLLIEPLPWLRDHCSTSLGVRYEMNINVGSMCSFGNGDIFKSKKHWLGEIYAMTKITKGLFYKTHIFAILGCGDHYSLLLYYELIHFPETKRDRFEFIKYGMYTFIYIWIYVLFIRLFNKKTAILCRRNVRPSVHGITPTWHEWNYSIGE